MLAELPPLTPALVCIPSLPRETSVASAARDAGPAIGPQRGPHKALSSSPSSQGPTSRVPRGTSHSPYTLQTPEAPRSHSPQCPGLPPLLSAPCRLRLGPGGAELLELEQLGLGHPQPIGSWAG